MHLAIRMLALNETFIFWFNHGYELATTSTYTYYMYLYMQSRLLCMWYDHDKLESDPFIHFIYMYLQNSFLKF